ncbi:MAG: alginate lyase family protein, partial [Saprospiraceae bacterium]|nr:alginate lyase family protein [Saprospiraceae bacterium]
VTVGLYYRTIKHLRPIQIQYRIIYGLRSRLRKVTNFKYSLLKPLSKNRLPLLIEPSISTSTKFNNTTVTFLNLSKSFEENIDWNYADHGKLWTYNLNYFEFLHQKNISKEEGISLMLDFVQQMKSSKDGLEPYPISLRIIHWVKFLSYHKIQIQDIDESLNAQISILLDQLEYHILGNHLLENGFGLFFGAYYFQDEKIYQKASEILKTQLEEQILEDGAHFELSPMYHQLMLYRVLDCINVVDNNSFFPKDKLPFLKKKAAIMLGWLEQITFSQGDIPLLNDCAFGINPTTLEIFDYANRLGVLKKNVPLKSSGYRFFSNKAYEAIIDIGQIGPDYIPGHAHCDTFNFVIYAQGKPWIIDSGTSTYNATSMRHQERSTSAHNTVEINGKEQSEIWGSFRVADRAKVIIEKETNNSVSAKHDGYANMNISHRRHFEFHEKDIIIQDEILGSENIEKRSKAFIHFHPDRQIELDKNKIKTDLGNIELEGTFEIKLEKYNFAPEFNTCIPAQKATIIFSDKLLTNITI